MKAKLALAAALLLASTLISCVGGHGSGSPTFPTTPKFLVAVDGCSGSPCAAAGAGANVNVFPINSTTGALGTAVNGAPFNMGMIDPMTIEVHPNGKWFYVADGSDGSIHQWNVDETTGVPTDITAKIVNESGSFYEPVGHGDSATRVLTVTPNGKYLYSANNDATVGAYSIGANGALSHIADVNVGACATGAITSTNSFVWVTDTCGSSGPWNVFTLTIGANGGLSNSSSIALTGVYSWLWSIQVNPAANLLYAADEGGTAQIYGYTVKSDGSLTQLNLGAATSTMQYQDSNSSDCRFLEHSPDGKFFYWTDDDDYVHSFSVDTSTGAVAELASSPYSEQASGAVTYMGGQGQVVVDQTGKFVYAAEVYSDSSEGTVGGLLAFTRDNTTGALTMIGTSDVPTANNHAEAIGIVR